MDEHDRGRGKRHPPERRERRQPRPAAAEPQVGYRAPDFTLPATTGGTISLSQFRGKKIVLLEFYGADFSPV